MPLAAAALPAGAAPVLPARRADPGARPGRGAMTAAPPAERDAEWRACVAAVAGARDRAAFARLFGHFAPRLKAFMMRGGADADLAEELAQEAMIAVWRRADSFDPAKAAVSTWVFTIARNKRIDRLRRERVPELSEEEYAAEQAAPRRGDDEAERRETAERLARSIASLPEEQAEVVRLAFYEDKPHAEIAAELSLPLGTVKSRIRLALARLRGLVTEDDR